MNKILFSINLLFVVFMTACGAQASANTHEEKTLVKFYSFNEGIELARKEKKPVFIDFYTDWCKWCKVMDKETFSDKTVADFANKEFIAIKINAEDSSYIAKFKDQEFTAPELTRAFGVTGYPAIGFLNKDQEPITIVPGYNPAAQFLNILKYLKEECYKKDVSMEEFLEKGCPNI
jgi:thioredoxin-related protein